MKSKLEQMADKLESAGYAVSVWQGKRVYVNWNNRQLGFLVESDFDGGTGSCKGIQARSGAVSAVLRGE